ncbi:MAG: signal peptidase II [Sedimentisphaerales bacterium]|jgi:signal peptidase II
MNGEQKTSFPSSVISHPSSVIRHLIFWPIFTGGLAFDLWTKNAVFGWLGGLQGQGIAIIDGFLRLQLAVNTGAAFGIAEGYRVMLVAVSAIALVVILAIFIFARGERKIVVVSLALFAAGVSGNLYDRVFNGGLVRDFIDVVYWPGRHWPAFNVADSMLCTAVGLLIISSLFSPESCQKPAQPQK